MKIDPTAVLWSSPERERGDRPLLVLLHGYGSHEGDLFQLSPRLPLAPVIASVRAPISESGGWAWFSLAAHGVGEPTAEDADAAAGALLEWLDTLEYSSVSMLGFSQGAVTALQAMRLDPERFASVVALSGFVASGDVAGDARLAEVRPPVFWGRGTEDPIIPDAAIERTADWLPAHSTATIRIYERLAHAVSSDELTDITTFLRAHEA
ncbi:MAG TPA: alpha/beta hydrolase-fold protein [Galbitalea sp.]|jgi:phospholipase/carboxylesterase|nr:alpha/beta hydrolase-fold protein [Galbitalea sp.]